MKNIKRNVLKSKMNKKKKEGRKRKTDRQNQKKKILKNQKTKKKGNHKEMNQTRIHLLHSTPSFNHRTTEQKKNKM